jgi:hypothetical protein
MLKRRGSPAWFPAHGKQGARVRQVEQGIIGILRELGKYGEYWQSCASLTQGNQDQSIGVCQPRI